MIGSSGDKNTLFNTGVWDQETRRPTPSILFNGLVRGSTWQLLYECPQGTFIELNKLYLMNPEASDVVFRFALLPPSVPDLSGGTLDQEKVILTKTLNSDSWDHKFEVAIQQGYRVFGYSTAAADENYNVFLDGLVVTYL